MQEIKHDGSFSEEDVAILKNYANYDPLNPDPTIPAHLKPYLNAMVTVDSILDLQITKTSAVLTETIPRLHPTVKEILFEAIQAKYSDKDFITNLFQK